MTEEGGQPAAAAPESTVTTQAPPVQPSEDREQDRADGVYLNADGTFVENWFANLGEDIRDSAVLRRFKDVPSMARTLVNAERMVGKNKIATPSENSTEQEWEAFWKAGGRPETPDDYNFSRPDELPEEMYSAELAGEAQALFHKLGLSNKQAQAIFQFHNANAVKAADVMAKAQQDVFEQATAALQNDWGAAFEQKKHLADVAVEQAVGGNEEFRQSLIGKYGNDPDFIRCMANLGSRFAEHGVVTTANVPTPSDLQDDINELMSSDAYLNGRNPAHKATVAKVQRLFEKKTAMSG